MKHKIILDTNVLVAGLKSSQGASFKILSLLPDSKIELQLSVPLVVEYESILQREIRNLSVADIQDFLDYLCSISVRHNIYYLWRPHLKDCTDDFLLELAVKTRAMIVTHNTKDFQVAVKKFDISVHTPQQFLYFLTSSS